MDSPDFQRIRVDPDMHFAPLARLGWPVLACVPLPFAFSLDAGTVDQQVQRPLGAAIRDRHRQVLLAAAQGAEIGHRPVQTSQLQQAFNQADHLPER